MLKLHKGNERIHEWNQRAIFKYGSISLLVNNMPDEEDKRGRLRDHIAYLLEGAELKLRNLEKNNSLVKLLAESKQLIAEIETEQKSKETIGKF